MKINLNFLKNKKIIFPFIFILLLLWISFLYSQTNLSKSKTTNVFPVISTPESTGSSKVINIAQINPAQNITPLRDSTVSIQNKQLTLSQNGSSKKADINQSVITFTPDNNYLLVTSGQMYSKNISYSLVNPTNLEVTNIQTDKLTPVTSLSVSPNGQLVAILGNYNSLKNTSNLYLKNLSSNQNSLLLSNTKYNTVKYLNDKQILVAYYSDSNEPNYTFGVFDLATNKLSDNTYRSSPKSTCFNSKIIAYYDFSSKSIKSLNLNDFSIKETKFSFPNFSTWLLCSENDIYAISPDLNKVSTRKINTISQTGKDIITQLDQTVFIQPFINNNKLIIKTLNQKDQTYQLLTVD